MLHLEREFDPAIAACGYRAPLAPRLARPDVSYLCLLLLSSLPQQRRGRDLNPRGSSPTRFPIVRTRPSYATSPSISPLYPQKKIVQNAFSEYNEKHSGTVPLFRTRYASKISPYVPISVSSRSEEEETLDLNQMTQLLTWLDEEHRKDKAMLMSLQSQLDVQKAQLTDQARQLQEVQAALTRIEAQLPGLAQIESSLQNIRTEFAGLLAKHAAEQEAREEARTRTDKVESETIARIVRQVQERVDALGSFDNTVAVLREEDSKLRSEMTRAFTQLAEITKRLEAQDQRITLVTQDVQALRDTLTSTRLTHEGLNSQIMALKAALEALGARLDAKIEQLPPLIEELGKKEQADIIALQAKLQDQDRLIDELGKEMQPFKASIARWTKQMEKFTEDFERDRKTLYDLRELERQIRQQGNEALELQRLAAERMRTELREWQDNQLKVDEEQTARLEQLLAWQQKVSKILEDLEQRLEQNRQDVKAHADELWQAMASYAQGQMKLLENLQKRTS